MSDYDRLPELMKDGLPEGDSTTWVYTEHVFERRRTIDRIRQAILSQRTRLGTPPEKIRVTDLLAILDEEANR